MITNLVKAKTLKEGDKYRLTEGRDFYTVSLAHFHTPTNTLMFFVEGSSMKRILPADTLVEVAA